MDGNVFGQYVRTAGKKTELCLCARNDGTAIADTHKKTAERAISLFDIRATRQAGFYSNPCVSDFVVVFALFFFLLPIASIWYAALIFAVFFADCDGALRGAFGTQLKFELIAKCR